MTDETLYDQQLLTQIAAGDAAAFRKLYDEHRDRLFSFALKFLHREDLAEELVQDVFLKIWTSRETLTNIQHIGAFLYTVTRNLCLSTLKRMAQEQEILHQIGKGMKNSNLTDDEVLHRDYQKLLQQAIDALPEQQRKVYLLSKEKGASRQEIADALQISPNTVKAHLTSATNTLRSWFMKHRGEMLALFIVLHSLDK